MAVASAGPYASLHRSDNHASTTHHSFFSRHMPFLPPNQQHQSTERCNNMHHFKCQNLNELRHDASVHCYLLHLQHCSCFRDVVIDQIRGQHCIEVSSYDCCHQVSDFKATMRQIRFRLGLRPRPRWGRLQRFPRPPSWI